MADLDVCSSGDAPAEASATSFEALFGATIGVAYGYALRLTHNQADAEDLVQEAALLAFKGFAAFQPGSNFKAWFFRILVREFFGRYRRSKRRPPTVSFDDVPDLYVYTQCAAAGLPVTGPDPAAQLVERLGCERVGQALDTLPTAYGMVCALYFTQDLNYQEIAEVLEIPVGTVRSRLHRGRKMLQHALWKLAVDAGIVAEPEGEWTP